MNNKIKSTSLSKKNDEVKNVNHNSFERIGIQELFDYKWLGVIIKQLEMDVMNAPAGRLRIAQNNGTDQYYFRDNPKDFIGKYISKKELPFIQKLAQKEYDEKLLKELHMLKRCMDKYHLQLQQLGWEKPNGELCMDKLENLYKNSKDARKKLISSRFVEDNIYAKNWEEVSYQGKEFEQDTLEIFTEKGERVRSKSEKIIADKLWYENIKYRYEYPLYLHEYGVIYPDFTLLDRKTRKEIIWEHFGMMDSPEYANNAIRKLQTYQRNGFFIGYNMIATFESSEITISSRLINEQLRQMNLL